MLCNLFGAPVLLSTVLQGRRRRQARPQSCTPGAWAKPLTSLPEAACHVCHRRSLGPQTQRRRQRRPGSAPPRRPPPGRPLQGRLPPLRTRRRSLMQHPLLPVHRLLRWPSRRQRAALQASVSQQLVERRQQRAALQALASRQLAGRQQRRVHGRQIGRGLTPAAPQQQLLLLVDTQVQMTWRHHSHSHRAAAAAWALQLWQRLRSSPSNRGLTGSCVRCPRCVDVQSDLCHTLHVTLVDWQTAG